MVAPLVSEFHSRDLDSIVSPREVAAVNDWVITKNKTFHIMRDHKQHGTSIPGDFKNIFGGKLYKEEIKNLLTIKEIAAFVLYL